MSSGGRFRPDWQCLSCSHINFARRVECERCRVQRPPDAPAAYAPNHEAVRRGEVAATHGAPFRGSDHNPPGHNATVPLRQLGGGFGGGGLPVQIAHVPAVLLPGDWCCPRTTCGALNGAQSRVCYACQTSKDYQGPDSAFAAFHHTLPTMNTFRSPPQIPQMHDPRPEGQYPPDWKCLACDNVNFARRSECKQCGASRTPDCPQTRLGADFKPDWRCVHCENINFARRTECKQCHRERTADAPEAYAPNHIAVKMGVTTLTPLRIEEAPRGHTDMRPPLDFKPDWRCVYCDNINFARRTECKQCRRERTSDAPEAYAPNHGALKIGSHDGVKPGDWTCDCGYNNFARRTECGKCDRSRPQNSTIRYSPY